MKLKQTLLQKYGGISEASAREANISIEHLEAIDNDFANLNSQLDQAAEFITRFLLKAKDIHSVRYRLKDPEHLLKKIIRKKKENPLREITPDNYRSEITDLIGVRAIHLFKEDWKKVNDFIVNTWEVHEQPTAYVRAGDTEEYSDMFKECGCEIKPHQFGYRSVHYIIKTRPAKEEILAEIQVRTIFEEGWSEIDHKVRYPSSSSNELIDYLLLVMNRLAGSADELGSFTKKLRLHMLESRWDYKEKLLEKDSVILELENKIKLLDIDKDKKAELTKMTSDLQALVPPKLDFSSLFPTQSMGAVLAEAMRPLIGIDLSQVSNLASSQSVVSEKVAQLLTQSPVPEKPKSGIERANNKPKGTK